MTVNIYTCTTAKKPINATAGMAFVIECETSKGPATLTHTGHLENITRNKAEIQCLMDALKKLNRECELEIYVTSDFTAAVLNNYLAKWEAAGWRNSRGEDVDEIYKELKNLLNPHKFYGKTDHHAYSEWLKREAEKEDSKCSTSTGNLTPQKS